MVIQSQNLLPLGAMARRLHVPSKWLRRQAETGHLPHLRADSQILFNPKLVEQLLIERATQGGLSLENRSDNRRENQRTQNEIQQDK